MSGNATIDIVGTAESENKGKLRKNKRKEKKEKRKNDEEGKKSRFAPY
jgi:hypothetical protein